MDDTKIGTWRQAEALASSWLKVFEKKPIKLPVWCRWMPPSVFNLLPDFLKELSVRRLGDCVPEVIIAAGRQAVLVALALRKKTTTVVIMNPCISSKYFNVVIAPAHDHVKGANVITTFGAIHNIQYKNLVFPEYLKKYSKPRVGLLLGGNSIHGDYQESLAVKMASDLRSLMEKKFKGGSLIITPSRRTPVEWINIFTKNLQGIPYWIWDRQSNNPYPNLLKEIDLIIVCEDSISMASEACIIGKPVMIYPTGIKKRKFKDFYQQLFDNYYAQPFNLEVQADKTATLDELDTVVRKLKFILKQS